jgi:hypothetical protein
MGLGGRELQPERQCSNGEAVAIRRAGAVAGVAQAKTATPPTAQPEAIQGNPLSLGFRAAGGPPPTTTGSTK